MDGMKNIKNFHDWFQ